MSGILEQLKALGGASLRGLPVSLDGLFTEEAAAPTDAAPSRSHLHDLFDQAIKGNLFQDANTLLQAALQAPSPLDDRKLLLEQLVALLAGLEDGSPIRTALTNGLSHALWEDLPHPVTTFLGDSIIQATAAQPDKNIVEAWNDAQDSSTIPAASPGVAAGATGALSNGTSSGAKKVSAPSRVSGGNFRSADGTGYTKDNLGAAGSHYARTVPAQHPLPQNLPDPSVVFEALLKRDKFVPHPSGISSLLFSFATLIIHSIFQTSRADPTINESSSYLDLSPLYGSSQDEQDTVRDYSKVGLGLLLPDTIASSSLFMMPPSVVALLIVFARNHNYIASRISSINEYGKYKPIYDLNEDELKTQDEKIFQTARLINCGYFANIIFHDYIKTILNLNLTDSSFSLIPTADIKKVIGCVPRGTGNAVSVEFNCLYRWHSTISEQDEAWITSTFEKYVPNKKPHEYVPHDLKTIMQGLASTEGGNTPSTRTIPGLTRDSKTGMYNDSDLCKILSRATDNVAGAFKARGTPAIMQVIDVLAIGTARHDWNTCSLNEFRKFLNLKPHSTFTEWNSDPEIARVAENLYAHPDNLELLPGLLAEEPKPSILGSGLAPGYTISRAILSDAVALVRGDPYLTTKMTVTNLTSWGFGDIASDFAGGSYGGILGKLLMRTMPNSYSFNSVYALFPFSTPETTRKNLTNLGVVDKYDFAPRSAPPPTHVFSSYAACSQILSQHEKFNVGYADAMAALTITHYQPFLGNDDKKTHDRDRKILSDALFPPGWEIDVKNFYTSTTARLIAQNSFSYDGGKTKMLDVVRDVTSIAPVLWVAAQFGYPLKTPDNPYGLFTPQQFGRMLNVCFAYVLLNFDVSRGFKLREIAFAQAKSLSGIIDLRLRTARNIPLRIDSLAHRLQGMFIGSDSSLIVAGEQASGFYRRLIEAADIVAKAEKRNVVLDELNASVQATVIGAAPTQGQVVAQIVNFYLDPVNETHYDGLVKLSTRPASDKVDAEIRAYCYEAMRLDPQVTGLLRRATVDITVDDVDIAEGDFVFCSMKNADLDPEKFPQPHLVKLHRPLADYKFLFGSGIHSCLGGRLVHESIVCMVRQVFKLKNVRRAPGSPGLFRFDTHFHETDIPTYISSTGNLVPYPNTMSIVYDAE